MDRIASELVKIAKELLAFVYPYEVQKAMTDLLQQIERHLGQRYLDALTAAEDGEYGFMKQIQYKITTMLRDLGADARMIKRGFKPGNQFQKQHPGYAVPRGVKTGAVLWFEELNDSRAFTQSRIALVQYVKDNHGIELVSSKLIG